MCNGDINVIDATLIIKSGTVNGDIKIGSNGLVVVESGVINGDVEVCESAEFRMLSGTVNGDVYSYRGKVYMDKYLKGYETL